MTRARVAEVRVPLDEPDGVEFIDEQQGDTLITAPSEGDRLAVRLLLESLPVGTVVERNGIGFAPLFRPRASRGAERGRPEFEWSDV